MTPDFADEEAERILSELCEMGCCDNEEEDQCSDHQAKHLAQALRAAYQKGMQEIREACTQHQHEQFADGYVKGFEAGKEMAAKVADLAPGTNGRWIAKEIRRLRPKGGEVGK